MGEEFFICVGIAVLVCLVAALLLSIIAISVAMRAQRETEGLARRLADESRRLPGEPAWPSAAPTKPWAAAPPTPAPVPPPGEPAATPPPEAPPPMVVPPRVVEAPPAGPPETPPAPRLERKPFRWEEWIGLKGLALAGIVVFLIGAALFAAYAHERGWFGRRGYFPVGLLVLGGFAFLVAAEVLVRRKLQVIAWILTGGGLAMEYFGGYAAWARFHIIPEPAAWIFMITVTAAAIFLSVRYASLLVAIVSLVGGLAGPVLISPDRDPGHVLFLYLIAINAGVLVLAYFKKWRGLNLLALVGTIVNVVVWLNAHYWYAGVATEKLGFIVAYMTVLWAMYFVLSVVYHLLGRRRPSDLDLPVTLVNVVAYFTGLYLLLRGDAYHHWLGPAAAALGAAYLAKGLATRRWAAGQTRFVLLQVGQAIGLLTLAIPIQLKGVWIPMAWAVEGTVLFWMGLRVTEWKLRAAGLLVHAASIGALIYYAQEAWTTEGMLVLNARTATFAAVALAMAASAWLYRRLGEKPDAERAVVTAAAALAHLLLMVLIGVEAFCWYETAQLGLARDAVDFWAQMRNLEWARDTILASGLAVYGLVAVGLVAAMKRALHHGMALVAFAASIITMLVARDHLPDLAFVGGWNRVGATFAGVAACLAAAALVSRYATRLALGARGMAITYELLAAGVVLSLYLTELGRAEDFITSHARLLDTPQPLQGSISQHHVDTGLSLSGQTMPSLWAAGFAVVAGLVVLRGFWVRSLAHRVVGLVAMAVALVILVGSTVAVGRGYETPLWQPRGVAFLLLIAGMALAVVGYLRAPAQAVPARRYVAPVLAVLVHATVLVCFTLEVHDFWNTRAELWFPNEGLHAWYARHATLSVGYALYALGLLAAGIRRRSTMLRVLALVILGGTLLKVMVLDLSRLEAIWRILSFVGLGLLLLAASLLYHKYRHVIFGAAAEKEGKKETSNETA